MCYLDFASGNSYYLKLMSQSRLTGKELQFLLVLATVQFNHIVDFMLMMPLGPQLMRFLNITTTQFGYLVSSYTFSAAISGLFCSLFMDRYDRKKLLLILSFGFSVGTALCGYTESYWALLTARCIAGSFGGVLGAVVIAIVSDGISYNKRGFAMGIMSTAFSAASIAGVPISLYIAQSFGWNMSFYALSALALILIVLLNILVPSQKQFVRTNTDPLAPIKNIVQNPHLITTLFFAAALVLGQFIVIPFLSPSLVANDGLLEDQLPFVYLFGGMITLVTGPFVGKLADIYGKHKMFGWGLLFAAISTILVTRVHDSNLWWTLLISTFFFVCVNARWIPAQAMITGSVEPEFRGSFMSYVSVVQNGVAGLGAIIAASIVYKDTAGRLINYDKVGYVSVFISLIAFLLSRKVKIVENRES